MILLLFDPPQIWMKATVSHLDPPFPRPYLSFYLYIQRHKQHPKHGRQNRHHSDSVSNCCHGNHVNVLIPLNLTLLSVDLSVLSMPQSFIPISKWLSSSTCSLSLSFQKNCLDPHQIQLAYIILFFSLPLETVGAVVSLPMASNSIRHLPHRDPVLLLPHCVLWQMLRGFKRNLKFVP